MRTPAARLRPALSLLCAAALGLFVARTPLVAATSATIGAHPAALAFRDLSGAAHSLTTAAELPAVYLFLGSECPVSNSYTPRILELEKTYSARGFHFLAVYPNVQDTPEKVQKHAEERGYTFTVVKDDGSLAKRLGATATPEVVVLDSTGAIRYRGRIDDNLDSTLVHSHDLRDALEAVLAGRHVAQAETKPFGCVIMSSSRTGHAGPITYARDIAPILQKNCVACHRKGQVAPFGLESYKEAAEWAKQLKAVTAARTMPPWKADSHGEFLDERRLTTAQIQTIGAWADAGAPAGNLKQTPAEPKFRDGWQLGKPDVIFGMEQPYTVEADGRDEYHCFVIPTHYAEDRYVSAVEVHPGNRAVVHHVIAYLDLSGKARELQAKSPGPGYTNPTPGSGPGFFPVLIFAGWAPGNEARFLPPGVGALLPKGADIVLEVHYHKDGKSEKDQSQIGLYFAKGPVDKRVRLLPVVNPFIRIPAGDAHHVETASMPVIRDITVLAVTPHMHLLGRSMKVVVTLPDKSQTQLVDVPDWDFRWQLTYGFKQPLKLPKGSVVSLEAVYDNSDANPNNPSHPLREVRWGEQTTDEMCLAFVTYTADEEHLTQGKAVPDIFDFARRSRRSASSQ